GRGLIALLPPAQAPPATPPPIPTPTTTPNNGNTDLVRNGTHACHPEGVLARQMDRWDAGQFQKKKLIIISHSPPYGTLDFAVRFGSRNIGSRPLRQFLDSSPNSVLCVCG